MTKLERGFTVQQKTNQRIIRNCMENFIYPESMTRKIRKMFIDYNKKKNYENNHNSDLGDCR